MKYCNHCKQLVSPKTEFNCCSFIILLFVFGLGLLYLFYYLLKPGKCPMCKSSNWGIRPSGGQGGSYTQPVIVHQFPPKEYQYCSACGEQIVKGNDYCSFCGARQ